MFHLLGYFVSAGANAANTQSAALTDSEFSARGTTLAYIFSEKYNLLAAAHLAVSATRARLDMPTINAIARHTINPVNRSATPPSDSRIQDLKEYPLELPLDEEMRVDVSNDLAMGNEDTTTFLWIAPPSWHRNLPRGVRRLTVRFTASVARVADSWSGAGAITFAENLRGGWYSVVGVYVQSANLRAFRINFVRQPMIAGRKFRPGSLATNALGNIEPRIITEGMGEWGRFHSFEPPQLEVYGDATGADTQEGRMDLIYLGEGNYGM